MLIDTIALKMPCTAAIALTLEISRIGFIFFSNVVNVLPLTYAQDTMQLITQNVVFLFILDIDNKLHK